MKVVITGGCGFLGQRLARAVLQRGSLAAPTAAQAEITSVILFDAHVPGGPGIVDPRLSVVPGDLSDRDRVFSLIDHDDDDVSVFHLGSVMSGGGEADFDQALQVNLDGTRNILEALRRRARPPRLVFTSSIAVFGGGTATSVVGDLTKQLPQTTYGTTKAIVELLVNDYTRKGYIDGRTARLPTVIVRPGAPNAAASSYISSVVREPLSGADVTVPVPMSLPMAVIGYRTAVECLVELHEVDGPLLGADRAVQLPSLTVTGEELLAALHDIAGHRRLGHVSVQPDPNIVQIIEAWPPRTITPKAAELGLPADSNARSIVEAFINDFCS